MSCKAQKLFLGKFCKSFESCKVLSSLRGVGSLCRSYRSGVQAERFHQLAHLRPRIQTGVWLSSVLVLRCSLLPHLARASVGDGHGQIEVAHSSPWVEVQ